MHTTTPSWTSKLRYTSVIIRPHKTFTLRRDDLNWLVKSFDRAFTDGALLKSINCAIYNFRSWVISYFLGSYGFIGIPKSYELRLFSLEYGNIWDKGATFIVCKLVVKLLFQLYCALSRRSAVILWRRFYCL